MQPGEETEDADKEALPVQPSRRGKAAAGRLDTAPDSEEEEGRGTSTPLALCGWYCLLSEEDSAGEPGLLVQKRKQQVGSGRAFF